MPEGAHHACEREDGDRQRDMIETEGGDTQERQGVGDIADQGLKGLDEDDQDLLAGCPLLMLPTVPGERGE
jgi:hypothetical protein